MIFHDIQQNTDEWDALRCGRLTNSALCKAMANFGKAFGEPAKKYATQIALEQITGKPCGSSYTNDAMQRGHEEEPLARMEYEEQYFCTVDNGGFFEIGDIGCSPDGCVGDDGLIEIKSAEPHIHFERIRKATFDSGYKWQLIGNMKLTGRSWIDFISYCKDFPEGKRIYVYRLKAEDFAKEYAMIDERVSEFKTLIGVTKDIILRGNYSIIGANRNEQ